MTALAIEIAVTSTAGTAVQTISRPVCPCTGGPSESSSGPTRNLRTAYTITAATSAKMAMQITVTNQKRKSIRSACLLAGSGSHGTRSATAAAPAPNTTPSPTSWKFDPLRTGAETTRRGGGVGREANARSG
jgi:hypothetical protein